MLSIWIRSFPGLAILALAAATLAGDLNPPPGPVAPTMVTLDSIEPRNILKSYFGDADSVIRITQPGQYVATENIVVPAGKKGIEIDLPPGTKGPVTIDLNQFEIQGQPGSLDGVRKDGAVVACDFNLHNGRIVGMGGDGVHIEGVDEAGVAVSVDECGGDGMEFLSVPTVSAVAIKQKAPPPTGNNRVAQCGGNGIVARQCGDVEIDFTIQDCVGDGMHIEECTEAQVGGSVSNCGGDGMEFLAVPTVSSAAINEKGTGAAKNRVANCGGNGVVATQCESVELASFRVSGSGGGGGTPGGNGLVFDTCDRVSMTDCSVAECSSHGYEFTDCEGVSMLACSFSKVDGDGIHAVSTAALRASKGRWLEIDMRSPAGSGNLCGGHGIYTYGIDTVSLSNGLIRACDGDGVHIEPGTTPSDTYVQVRGFRVERCAGDGMEIECGDLTMAECATQDNGGNGVYAKNIRKNITVTLFKSHRNGLHGLYASDVAARGGYRQQGKSTQVTRSNISNNRAAGVHVEIIGPLTMAEVECDGNDQEGTFALLLPALGSVQEKAKWTKCRFVNNGFGTPTAYPGAMIQGASSFELREWNARVTRDLGLVAADFDRDGRLDVVTCSSNGGHGVQVFSSTGTALGRFHAQGVVCDGNASTGMYLEGTTGGEVRDCAASNNGTGGIFVFGNGHVVRSNSCTNNGGPPLIVPVPGNVVGPLVDEMSVAGTCNSAANYVH